MIVLIKTSTWDWYYYNCLISTSCERTNRKYKPNRMNVVSLLYASDMSKRCVKGLYLLCILDFVPFPSVIYSELNLNKSNPVRSSCKKEVIFVVNKKFSRSRVLFSELYRVSVQGIELI